MRNFGGSRKQEQGVPYSNRFFRPPITVARGVVNAEGRHSTGRAPDLADFPISVTAVSLPPGMSLDIPEPLESLLQGPLISQDEASTGRFFSNSFGPMVPRRRLQVGRPGLEVPLIFLCRGWYMIRHHEWACGGSVDSFLLLRILSLAL